MSQYRHNQIKIFHKYSLHKNIAILTAILVLFTTKVLSAAPSATDVVRAGEEKMRGNTSFSRARITIHKSRVQRSMTIDSWDSRVGDKTFMRILRPKKDKGITFLKRDKNLWQYIPSIGKEIKIESSLMNDSWMGSDFTNDDLVKQSSVINDYFHTFDKPDDALHYKIIFKPKPDSAVIWTKIVFFSRVSDMLPDREEFYDHKGRMVKLMVLDDFKPMGGRVIPTRLEMSTIKDGRKISSTIMETLNNQFDLAIPESIFSKANMRR